MANFPPRAGSGNQSSSQPTGQPTGQPGSGSPAVNPVQTGSGTVTGLRTAGVRPCPSCSTLVNVHATVCPNCGEQIATKEKTIRCRRCRHRASSNLVVCPHCGRDLQPATSRWLTWGLPLLAVFFLSGALVFRAGRGDPASWGQAQVERIVRLVESLTSRLQPDVTISMIPAGQDPNDPLVSQAAQAGADLSAEPAGNQVEIVDVVATSAENTSAATSAALDAGSVAGDPPLVDAPLVDAAVAVTPTAVVSDIALPPAPAEVAPAEPAATATIAPPTATAEPTAEPTGEATATQVPTSTPTGTATGTATATIAATQTATTSAYPSCHAKRDACSQASADSYGWPPALLLRCRHRRTHSHGCDCRSTCTYANRLPARPGHTHAGSRSAYRSPYTRCDCHARRACSLRGASRRYTV